MILSKEQMVSIYMNILNFLKEKNNLDDENILFNISEDITYQNIRSVISIEHLNEVANYIFSKTNNLDLTIKLAIKIPELFLIKDYKDKISFLYNGYEFYGVIVCDSNNMKCYIADYNYKAYDKSNSSNYILTLQNAFVRENFLSFYQNDYLKDIMGILSTDDLQTALIKARTFNQNEKGYHIK